MKKLFLIFAMVGGTSFFVVKAVEEIPDCPVYPVGMEAKTGKCVKEKTENGWAAWCNTNAIGIADCVIPLNPPVDP